LIRAFRLHRRYSRFELRSAITERKKHILHKIMKGNRLNIQINKPLSEVFVFTITPPNSTSWIPGIIKEETNEFPIKVGTIYRLQDEKRESAEVIVKNLKENKLVEWISKDQNYHCRYVFKGMGKNVTQFDYFEWVDKGEIEEPFTLQTLGKLKSVLES